MCILVCQTCDTYNIINRCKEKTKHTTHYATCSRCKHQEDQTQPATYTELIINNPNYPLTDYQPTQEETNQPSYTRILSQLTYPSQFIKVVCQHSQLYKCTNCITETNDNNAITTAAINADPESLHSALDTLSFSEFSYEEIKHQHSSSKATHRNPFSRRNSDNLKAEQPIPEDNI